MISAGTYPLCLLHHSMYGGKTQPKEKKKRRYASGALLYCGYLQRVYRLCSVSGLNRCIMLLENAKWMKFSLPGVKV